ncbi:rhomboid family intramembrane serine protease [Salinibacillus xinjiangensis]|nr:rhomboid family intramembrane serine protease [Salinibacillus xinjiangensis]
MYIYDEYYFWSIAHQLLVKHEFNLLQVNEQNQEVWLEKSMQKKSVVIRLYLRSFDWANHVKQDLATVMQRVSNIQKALKHKDITVHNVYVAENGPVDDWESLKKPHKLKDKKNILVQSYYLEESVRNSELNRLFDTLNLTGPNMSVDEKDPEETANQVHRLKHQMMKYHHQKKKEIESLFTYGKPRFTYFLLAVNIIMFYLLSTTPGGSTDTKNLINWGAKFNPYILEGEWWRIFSSMFLHIGGLHIFMNMIALYYLGNTVERMYGSIKFVCIYILAGLFGGMASFALNDAVAAGASGAIFGLFGALLFFGLVNKKLFFQTMGSNLLFIIGLNIFLGISVPSIDNSAHVGGLIGGFLAAAMVQMPKRKKALIQLSSFVLYAVAMVGLMFYGIEQSDTSNSPQTAAVLAQEYLEEERYDEAIDLLSVAIQENENKNELLYFNRSVAYYYTNNMDNARSDLETVIEINPEFAEAHYNLALVYSNLDLYDQAYEHAEQAVKLKPDQKDWVDFKEQLTEIRNSLN